MALRGACSRLLILVAALHTGACTSLLCGLTKSVELGGGAGAGAALALALIRPRPAPGTPAPGAPTPCKLRLSAPNAAAFTVRLIDVKESILDYERAASELQFSPPVLSALGGAAAAATGGRKWSARTATPAQDTAAEPPPPVPSANKTEPCTLSVYIGEARTPIWRLGLCGGNAASVAARAGTKLLPPRIKIVWNPPTTPYHHTEKLRLVVTAVNSGAICSNSSQFSCGTLGLCVSSSLMCDGVNHCPGGEDEEPLACAQRRDPPALELLRRLAARNQELLGLEPTDVVTKPSVIMKIGETEQKTSTLTEFGAALKSYGPWGYLVIGMFICITVIMFCLVWECCCQRSKPSDTPLNIPPACRDLAPTMTISATDASQIVTSFSLPSTPPAYEPPPSYSSLFPRAFKSSPTPVPHCSHEPPPD